MFARADEIEVLALDLIHHAVHLFEAHDARNDVGADHEGRDAVGEALADHEVACIGEHRGMQARHVAREIVKALAARPSRAVDIDALELFQNVEVIRDFEIGHLGLQEALALDVLGIVFADGRFGGDDVGDRHHHLLELFGDLPFLLLDLGKAFGVGIDLRLDLLRLLRLLFAHEHADLLGERIAAGAKVIPFLREGAAARVERERLVDEGELFLLEFLSDVLAHQIGLGADEIDVDHICLCFS